MNRRLIAACGLLLLLVTLVAAQTNNQLYLPLTLGGAGEVVSPTDTVTTTPTATSTQTITVSPTQTETATVTASSTGTATQTPTETSTPTSTATATDTSTATQTRASTATPTSTRTATATRTQTATASSTRTATPTRTGTATRTATRTATQTRTATSTRTSTATRTATPTRTGTATRTPTATTESGPWNLDYSGGLVPRVSSDLADWDTTSRVGWKNGTVRFDDYTGQRQQMQDRFTAPDTNYVVDFQARISDTNTLHLDLLSGDFGTRRYTLTMNGDTIVSDGITQTYDVTPINFNGNQWVRYRVVVRPSHSDVIAFAYYLDPTFHFSTRDQRLKTTTVKRWAYSGAIGAVRLRSDAAGEGAIDIREVSVKPLLGILIGDSIGIGAGRDGGYDPAPEWYSGKKSGDTHSFHWYLERDRDPNFTWMIMNQGMAGHTLNTIIPQVSEFIVDPLDGAARPRVLLSAGSNDIRNGVSAENTLIRLDRVLRGLSGIPVAVTDLLPRRGFTAAQEEQRDAYNATIDSRAGPTVRIVHLAETPGFEGANGLADEWSIDGVHLIWEGYEFLAPVVIDEWNQLP